MCACFSIALVTNTTTHNMFTAGASVERNREINGVTSAKPLGAGEGGRGAQKFRGGMSFVCVRLNCYSKFHL